MKLLSFQMLAPALLIILSASCSPAPVKEETPLPAPVEIGMPVPSTDGGPAPVATEMVVTEVTTRVDEAYGYQFDYPSAWMLDAVVPGSRAPGGYQLTSWTHEPGMISEVAPGGTVMNIWIQLWDPKADLAAFVEQRKSAWEASGIAIVSEEDLTLANGESAKEFVIESAGHSSYMLLTVLGENYLVASGDGDLELVRQVARSLR